MNKSASNIQLQKEKINKYREKIQKDLQKNVKQGHSSQLKKTTNDIHLIKSFYPDKSVQKNQKTQRKIPNFNVSIASDEQIQIRKLLTQNRQLTILLHQKNETIKVLEKKHLQKQKILSQTLQNQIRRLRKQKQNIETHYDKQSNVFIVQIAKLHDQINILQSQHKKREETILNQHKKIAQKIQQSNKQNIVFLNKAIKAQKDLAYEKTLQIQKLLNQIHQHKNIQSQKDQIITALKKQLQHISHYSKISASQLKILHQNQIGKLRKSHQEEMQREKQTLFSKIGKLQLHIQQLTLENQRNLHQIQILKQQLVLSQTQAELDKQKIKKQIFDIEVQQKNIRFKERQSLQTLSQTKLKISQESHQQLVAEKDQQIIKLTNINKNRSIQIKKLSQQIEDIRKTYLQQEKNKQRIIQTLQKKLKEQEKNKQIQLQAMKIKVGVLSQGNMKSLKQFYQHQLELLNSNILQKNKIIQENRKTINDLIKQKQQLRKELSGQISSLRLSIISIKSQQNQKELQIKEQSTGSQTKQLLLINKYKNQYQFYLKELTLSEDKNKTLQKMIQAKDLQIQQLNQKISLLKQKFISQIQIKQQQIKQLSQSNQKIAQQLKKEKQYYQKQLHKKLQEVKITKQYFSNQVKQIKRQENQQIYQIIHQLNNDKSLLQEDLAKTKREYQNIKNQFEVYKKMQNLQIDSLKNDLTREKEKYIKDQTIILQQLQSHYKELVSSKQDEIKSNKQEALVNKQEIFDLRENYQLLSKKFQDLVESFSQKNILQKKILQMHSVNANVSNLIQVSRA